MENLAGYSLEANIGDVRMLRGEPGKSAYEIAVQNGYSGTETEWLASLSGSGLSSSERSTLIAVVNAIGAFNVTNGQELIDAFNDAWVQKIPATGITLSAVSISFIDGTSQTLRATVEPSDSTDTVVWSSSNPAVATVSNGVVTPVANGDCVITATAGSVSASCAINVAFAEEVVYYTVTNNLTNCTSDNAAASVVEGGSYIATLTADEGYELDSVTVTMGGDDITGSVYAYGGISISSVTGNIVITATAVEKAVEDDPEAYNWTSGEAYVIDEWTDGYKLTYDTSAPTSVETITEDSVYSYSKYLPCAGVSAFVASSGLYFNYSMDHVYDSGKAYMGFIAKHTADNTPFGGVTYLGFPMGAKYLRLTTYTADKATSTVTPYKFDELTANTIPEDGKIYAVTPTAGVELNATTGVVIERGSCCTSDFMACYGFKTFHFADGMRKCVCFYDSDKKFISGLAYGAPYTGAIPEGAAYMRHTCTTVRNTLIVLSKEETA